MSPVYSLCPGCASSAVQWIEACSRDGRHDYFRCEQCWCVWAVSRDGPDYGPKIITARQNAKTA